MIQRGSLRWKLGFAFSALVALQVGSIASEPLSNVMVSKAYAATQTIASSVLQVNVDTAFPKVNQYTWLANGAVMYGSEDTLNQVYINGTAYTPTVSF